MTIYTNPRLRQTFMEELPASRGMLARTAATDPLNLPAVGLQRMEELNAAREGRPIRTPPEVLFGEAPRDRIREQRAEDLGEEIEAFDPGRMLTRDEAASRVQESGYDVDVPEDGIYEPALNLMLEIARENRVREDVFNRAPQDIGTGALVVGSALVGSVMDPLNVASAFIPIVGPARYARLLQGAGGTLGRIGVRARVGAIEGAAGAVLVEPIVMAVAEAERRDYGLTDTLLNIAFGTALGGGLHIGAGAVGDTARAVSAGRETLPRLLDRVDPEVREGALRTGVAQAMTGRQVDVEPVVGRALRDEPIVVGRAGPGVLAEDSEDFLRLSPTRQELERNWRHANELGLIEEIKRTSAEGLTARQAVAEIRGRLDAEGRGAEAEQVTRPVVRASRFKLGIPSRGASPTPAQARAFERWREAYRASVSPLSELPATDARAATPQVQRTPQQDASVEPLFPHIAERRRQRAAEAARQSFNDPTNRTQTDFDAAADVDARLQQVPDDEALPQETLEDAMLRAQQLADNLGDSEVLARELAEFDELIKTADDYGKAVRAAANCQLRKGG